MKSTSTILGIQHSVLAISSSSQTQNMAKKLERQWKKKECFEKDLDTAISECVALYGEGFTGWPGEVQEIVVNMMFNMGRTRLSGFKNFRKGLEANDWKEAAKEGRDSKWYRQVTNRAERLMSRLEQVS